MSFTYHWQRNEANFGPVMADEVAGGTHLTIESVLMFNGAFVALRRPGAIPHHELPQRVGRPLLYFVHDLPLWGESLDQYVKRIVREQAGVGVQRFRVVDLTMKLYEKDQQWAVTPFLAVELAALPTPGTYGNAVTEVVSFTKDDIPDGFGWYTKPELAALLAKI